MGDFRTKCSVCGKTIRVQTGTKKRRCVNCDFIDFATKMTRERPLSLYQGGETPNE
jgi:hypothetical protein